MRRVDTLGILFGATTIGSLLLTGCSGAIAKLLKTNQPNFVLVQSPEDPSHCYIPNSDASALKVVLEPEPGSDQPGFSLYYDAGISGKDFWDPSKQVGKPVWMTDRGVHPEVCVKEGDTAYGYDILTEPKQ